MQTEQARRWLALAFIIVLIGVVYGPTLDLTFYEEDPSDFGEAVGIPLPDLFAISTSALYYRPVHLAYFQLTSLPFNFDPFPAHLIRLGVHVANVFLLYLLLQRLWGQPAISLVSALLMAIHPMGVHGVARLTASQVPLTLGMLVTLVLYLEHRLAGSRLAGWLVVPAFAIALLVQETAAVLLPMVLLLEFYFIRTERVERIDWKVPVGFVVALAGFLALWSQVEKTGTGFLEESFSAGGAVYLMQAAALPFARLLAAFVVNPSIPLTAVVLVAGLALLSAWYVRRGRALEFGLLLAFYLGVLAPTWMVKEFGYFIIGERTFYPALPWAAALWAGHLLEPRPERHPRPKPSWLAPVALAVIAALSIYDSLSLVRLHRVGSDLMRQILAVQVSTDESDRLLFVNVPDRFHYERPPYPIGDWGMVVAPISMDLSRYASLRYGAAPETESITAWGLAAGDVARTPYFIITRGVDSNQDALYAAAQRADGVYMVVYHPRTFELHPIGSVRAESGNHADPLATFGEMATLLDADLTPVDDALHITLHWQSLGGATPEDTVFVHVSGPDLVPVRQADGDALGGLLPLTSWRRGDIIEDRRLVTGLPPGEYAVIVGLYNRSTGARHPASASPSREVFPGGVQVGQVTISG